MADINVNVVLPDPISVDVTSPTQALATNVSIPGPQGPRGEKGNPTSINSLTAENIIITGANGNIVSTSGTSTIFISGNSGYFESRVNTLTTNLDSTGSSLLSTINTSSGYLQTQINNLDTNYATDSQLISTGSILDNKITSLSGYVNSQDSSISNNLTSTGTTLVSNINTVASNLSITGNTLNTKIDTASGYLQNQLNNLDNNYATDSDLISTGQTLNQKINTFSGTYQSFVDNLDLSYATDTQLQNTGSTLSQNINNLSGTLTNNYYLKSNPSGFITGVDLSNYYTKDNPSGFITGVDLSSYLTSANASSTYATITNLASTGSSLQTQIDNLDNTYATDTSLASTGSTLNNKINSLSGTLTSDYLTINSASSTYATINNLNSSGNTLQNNINTLSNNLSSTGDTLISSINSLTNNLISTGQTLDIKINNLSGSSVLLYGDQTIDGTKTFRDSVYIHNLYVTGAEFIATTENNFVQSPYLLLNLTGGAFDGGIFFVTGSGLTGINDLGPIIGFDHTDKFKFGISSRGADLSTLNDIAAFQDITAYSGFVNGKYATIINLGLTGNNLQTQINNLYSSGFITGVDLSNYVTKTNGQFNDRPTVNGTGVLLSGEAANVDLSSTVQITGDQTISGNKIFTNSGRFIEGINIFSGDQTLVLNRNLLDFKMDFSPEYETSGYSFFKLNAATSNPYIEIENVSGLLNAGNFPYISLKDNRYKNYPDGTTILDRSLRLFDGNIILNSGNKITFDIAMGAVSIGDLSALIQRSNLYSVDAGQLKTDAVRLNASGTTGLFLELYANNLVYLSNNQNISGIKNFYSRPTVNGTGVLLSGEAAALPETIVYTTGDQTISGVKTFIDKMQITGNETGIFLEILDGDIEIENANVAISGGSITLYSRPTVNGSGVLLHGENVVYTTGNQNINGQKIFNDGAIFQSNPVIFGSNVTFSSIANFTSTSSQAYNFSSRPKVNNTGVLLSGEVTPLPNTVVHTTGTQTIISSKDFTIRPTLNGTGFLISGEAAKLPDTIVYTTGNQTILGLKTFGDNTKIILDPIGSQNEFYLTATSGVSIFELIGTESSVDYELIAGSNSPLISGSPRLDIVGNILFPSNPPISTGDIGLKGTITWDTGYLYVCIDNNSWKRVGLSTW